MMDRQCRSPRPALPTSGQAVQRVLELQEKGSEPAAVWSEKRLARARNLGLTFSQVLSLRGTLGQPIQRESEEPTTQASELALWIGALARQAALARLTSGRAVDLVVSRLAPRQGAIAAMAKSLPEAARQGLIFLYGVVWNVDGHAWIAQSLQGDRVARDAAYKVPFLLNDIDVLRRDLAAGGDAVARLAEFDNRWSAQQQAELPAEYRTLLHGYRLIYGNSVANTAGGTDTAETAEAIELAQFDATLGQLHAVVRAFGPSRKAGEAVALAMQSPAAPRLVAAASSAQRVDLIVAARAAEASGAVATIVAHSPKKERQQLERWASNVAWFHRDLHGWVLGRLAKDACGLEEAQRTVEALQHKRYWGDGVPRHAAIEDRVRLVFAIQAKLEQHKADNKAERRAEEGLRQAREAIYNDASERDAGELRAASSKAIRSTPVAKREGLLSSFAGRLLDLAVAGFKRIARGLGIDVDKLLAPFHKAGGGALSKLIKQPGKVASYFGKALVRAFKLVRENLGGMLVGGLAGFLTGALAKDRITLPRVWNLRSIAGLLLQVLGLGYNGLRAIAVKVVGAGKVDRAEAIVGELLPMFEGGTSALLDSATAKLGEIKTTVIETLRGWIIDSVLQPLLVRLGKILIPGLGIVTALKSLWGVVQMLLGWADRLGSVVDKMLDSVKLVVEEKVEPAAQAIYNAVRGVVPVLIGLAGGMVLGSGFGKALRKAIGTVGGKVQDMVQWLLERAAAMLGLSKKKKNAPEDKQQVSSTPGAWRDLSLPFERDGERHHLSFQHSGQLIVNSRTLNIRKYIDGNVPSDESEFLYRAVANIVDIQKLEKSARGYANIRYQGGRITKIMHWLVERLNQGKRPVYHSIAEFDGGDYGGTEMDAIVAFGPGSLHESRPVALGAPVGALNERIVSGDTRKCHRAHLLAKHLHGPGFKQNLMIVPGFFNTGDHNRSMRPFERLVSEQIYRYNEPIHYKVTVEYGRAPEPIELVRFIPKKVTLRAWKVVVEKREPAKQRFRNCKNGTPIFSAQTLVINDDDIPNLQKGK